MDMAISKEIIVQFEELEYYQRPESVHHQDVKVDFHSLFRVVKDVLKDSTSVAEKCLLGNTTTTVDDPTTKPIPSINCSLNLLKRIYCAAACEEEGKREPSALIANILRGYSAAESAVMTLAAFALSYGELLFCVESHQQLNPFAFLVSSFRRVDEIHRVRQEDQFRRIVDDLNRITNAIVEFIEIVLELENHSNKIIDHSSIIVNEITTTVEHHSRFAIQVAVACMKQVNCLTYDKIMVPKGGLSSMASALDVELGNLTKAAQNHKSRAEQLVIYSELQTSIRRGDARGIVGVMTRMMHPCEPLLYDCTIKKPVKVEEALEGSSDVLLFISEVEISENDYLSLKMIQEKIEKERLKCKIVWIPVLRSRRRGEEVRKGCSTGELEKLSYWQEKMRWYVVCYEANNEPIIGIKFIKETWQFSYKPMAVVLNADGALKYPDAIHIIRACGPSAFPFDPKAPPPRPTLPSIIYQTTNLQVKEEEYAFFYGGKDLKWIQEFGVHVNKLVAAQELARTRTKIHIAAPLAIGVKISSTTITQFWTRIESMLYARMQQAGDKIMDDDEEVGLMKQIQKVLSFKEESCWAVVCKGSRVLTCEYGATIMEAVAQHTEWTKRIGLDDDNSFERCLITHLDHKKKNQPRIDSGGSRMPCRHVKLESLSGWLPLDVECPDCGERMERVVTYQCCHQTYYNNIKKLDG